MISGLLRALGNREHGARSCSAERVKQRDVGWKERRMKRARRWRPDRRRKRAKTRERFGNA
jgi:hypothetical protein